MRIKLADGLIAQNILVVLLIIFILLLPSFAGRIILGLPFLLFFPGYTLILALFPKKDQIGNIERLALSFGLSIATVPLIGLILNYTPIGITLHSTLFSITGFIFIVSVIAWFRRRGLDGADRISININLKIPAWGETRLDRTLSVIMVMIIIASIGILAYAIANPKVGEKFSEFYILNLDGQASDYPTNILIGEEASVLLGVVNHEQETVDYLVTIVVSQSIYSELQVLSIANDDKWEQVVSFSASSSGDDQKIEFLLYKDSQEEVYHSLHLWVDVK